MSPRHKVPHMRCAVVEDGEQCPRVHILTNPYQLRNFSSCRWICEGHQSAGYAWHSVLMEDPRLEGQMPSLPTSARDLSFVSGTSQGANVLHGWGVVKQFFMRHPQTGEQILEDQLMLRLDETKDRQAPRVERRNRQYSTGFAVPPSDDED